MYNLFTLVDRLDFICKRKRKSTSVTEKKNVKKILTVVKSELFIREIHSQWLGGETKYSRILTEAWGLSVGGPFTETMMNIYRLSIAFF